MNGREAAGHQCRVGAMRLHGGNQGAAAGHEGDPLTEDLCDDPLLQPLQQPHALRQRPSKSSSPRMARAVISLM